MIDRNLCGTYLRIKRGDKWTNICFSDLTEDEMDDILSDREDEWLRCLCKELVHTIKKIGDDLNIEKQ